MSCAYIGVGSNLEDPERQVRSALLELGSMPSTMMQKHSSLYRSPPVGPPGQPDYVNAVAQIETGLSPHDLLDRLQSIENAHGRTRGGERWGPRPLDLDLLMYDRLTMKDSRLTLPHPEIANRGFVLCPLLEIAPRVQVPGLGEAGALLRVLGNPQVQRITGHG
jgi:2-amino-4-hydroxy-6-hydroxymethyldihydropteridine diphosphokinase